MKFLEMLIDKAIKTLEDDSFKPKMQDALKAIKLTEKVAKTSDHEKLFWELIDDIRAEELSGQNPDNPSLESQIQSIILTLKDQVKNGILPVKIITDTFNQDKSKEGKLSYHRIGRLLSAMGFRKAKTHAGTYAILWDDNLLYQNTVSNDEKNENQPSASPASPACPACP